MKLAALALLAGLAAPPQAPVSNPEPGNPDPGVAVPGSELTVTLLTIDTGGLLWERFGHNGIWMHDAANHTDHLYDWGRFSFEQANFFSRLAQGKMWYSMGDTDEVERVIRFYAGEGRKIWAQELNLTPEQRVALRDFLLWNIRPENAEYAYNYYLDNCSTRVRDALDKVLGGSIRRSASAPSGFTWRDETRRLDQHDKVIYTSLMIALGRPVDSEMTRWDQMFLPMRLREHLDSVQVTGVDGASLPLVRSERVLFDGGRWPVPLRPANWAWGYLITGIVLGGLLAWLGKRRGWAFIALATLWELLAGLFGLILTYLWAFTNHRAAHSNENLLLFNALTLALAVVLPSAVRGRAWAILPARRLALVVVVLAAAALVLKLLPGFHQSNLELIALALPMHLGVYAGLRTPAPS